MLDMPTGMRELLLKPTGPPFDNVGSLSVPEDFHIGVNDGAAAGQTVMRTISTRSPASQATRKAEVRRIMSGHSR
jgi:hypothetical protein